MGRKLVALRSKLLRMIDRKLSRPDASNKQLVEYLTAFALATSSSITDVLVHFQHVRTRSIKQSHQLEVRTSQQEVIRRLQLYTSTCRAVRALFPDLVKASLRSLSAAPLISDSSVKSLESLELGRHGVWLNADVQNYTAFTRSDDLTKPQAEQMLQEWTRKALGALLTSIQADLVTITQIDRLIEVRKEALQLWLSTRQYVRTTNHENTLMQLRTPFIERAKSILEGNVQQLLSAVATPLMSSISRWDAGEKSSGAASLWDRDLLSLDTSNGATDLRLTVVQRRYGKIDLSIAEPLIAFQSIAKELERIPVSLRKMRDTQWDDEYAFDDEYHGEQYDDVPQQSTISALTREDPDVIAKAFRAAIGTAFASIEDWISEHVGNLDLDCSSDTSPGLAIVRLLRGLRQEVPRLRLSLEAERAQAGFCQSTFETYQARLVTSLCDFVKPTYLSSTSRLTAQIYQQRPLWDGTPPLPVLPSAAAFKFLRTTVKRMEYLGTDLWSPTVVEDCKERLQDVVREALSAALHEIQSSQEAPAKPVDGPQQSKHAPKDGVVDTSGPDMINGDTPKEDQANDEGQAAETANESRDTVDDNSNNDEVTETTTDDETHDKSDGKARQQSDDKTHETSDGTSVTDLEALTSAAKEQHRYKLVQLTFDARYLQHALALPDASAQRDALADIAISLEKSAELPRIESEKIGKNAADYWKRTYLLFGLLSY